MLASGSLPIAGKVVSSSPLATGGTSIVLEIVPLTQLMRNVSVSVRYTPAQVASFVRPLSTVGSAQKVDRANAALQKTFGRFDCTTSFDPALLNVDLQRTNSSSLAFAEDFENNEGVVSWFVEAKGTVETGITGQVEVFGATGEAECISHVATIPIPIGGAMGFFIGPTIPIDVKLKASLAATTNVSYGLSANASSSLTFGLKYRSADGLTIIGDGDLQPTLDLSPSFANTAVRVNLTTFGGLSAGLTIGNAWFGNLPNAVEFVAGRSSRARGACRTTLRRTRFSIPSIS